MKNGDAKNILSGIQDVYRGALTFSQREALKTAIDAMTENDSLRAGLEELQATHDALLNVSAAGVRSLDAKIEELRRKLDGAQAVMEEVAKLDPAEIANFGIVRMARAWLIAGTLKENAPDE